MSYTSSMKELIDTLAEERGISKKEAKSIMTDVTSIMRSAILNGGITLKGFMAIKPVLRKGREGKIAFGKNKGQTWKTEDKYVLSVKASADMESELNSK